VVHSLAVQYLPEQQRYGRPPPNHHDGAVAGGVAVSDDRDEGKVGLVMNLPED
jgi:hypothetical protein